MVMEQLEQAHEEEINNLLQNKFSLLVAILKMYMDRFYRILSVDLCKMWSSTVNKPNLKCSLHIIELVSDLKK